VNFMERERTIIGSLLLLQLILWLGFLVHRSPRFPGSPAGGILAVSGALLMIVPPILYSAAKRVEFFKRIITKRISLGTLLSWHVYTSIVGSILAILHTGHRFESTLGITLTATMLLAVLSGFVGRYFLGYVSMELREKRDLLNRLATEYNRIVGEMSRQPVGEIADAASHGFMRRAVNSIFGADALFRQEKNAPFYRAVRLAESIADLEYAIKTHELLKSRTARWLKFHLAASCAFYLLLTLHVWAAIYYGLRWFD
jgi:hypothetical protein